MPTIPDEPPLSAQIDRADLEPIAVLGIGGFGCVELVRSRVFRPRSCEQFFLHLLSHYM